jgi:hypothetical protein
VGRGSNWIKGDDDFMIKITYNTIWASEKRLKLDQTRSTFTKVKWVFQVILLRSRKFYKLRVNRLGRDEC